MRTSEARKAALKIAVEMYEAAEGSLRFYGFDIGEFAGRIGLTNGADIQSVEHYLTSTGIMQHMGLGETPLTFTPEGVRVVESSIDQPTVSHGPFPPLSVIIGDVHGSQIAIGNGSFSQAQTSAQPIDLQHLADLIKAAAATWDGDARSRSAGSAALVAAEALSPSPDLGLVNAAAKKIGAIALTIADSAVSQALLAYLKSHGLLP